MADKPLSILIIEDNEDDAQLLVRLLRQNGYEPLYTQVWTETALREALTMSTWDLIVCDFYMPKFSGIDALKIVRGMEIDTPFVVLSGVVGEEKAVEMMLAGANDYVMKDNMSRLIPAIRRELLDAQSRRDKKRAEQELEKYRNHLEDLVHERTKELQNVQTELLRKERMALLGQLVATVSHEICNPLGVIRNAAFLLKRKLEGNGDCQEYVEIIEREVDAANRIISNLSETTRAKSPNRQYTNLDTMVDEIMQSIKLPDSIQFHYHRNPRPFMLNADRMQLKQVLSNLLTNAVQAVGDKGHVMLLVSSQQKMDTLKIIDTGPGIPDNLRKNIFEPLFTTKAKGTGLGLWISKEIIHRHKGSLKVINHSDIPQKELQTIRQAISKADDNNALSSSLEIGACFEITVPH
ncbi:MAG TPA: ATP-binding protein [Gammaproteobacteria bacterium]